MVPVEMRLQNSPVFLLVNLLDASRPKKYGPDKCTFASGMGSRALPVSQLCLCKWQPHHGSLDLS